MNFDNTVNKILHEAYFSSPHEKATGIKRHVELPVEEEAEDILDSTADSFMQNITSSSALQGTKMRVNLGLRESTMVAYEAWLSAGSPAGKQGADIMIDAYLNSDSGVTLAGDEAHVHDLMRDLYGLAYLSGVKNEKLANHEAKQSELVARSTGMDPEDVFEARWEFHFDLDETGTKPKPLTKEEKAAGINTKRQGKPLVSGERLRNILQQAQLKLKKGMDVQKSKEQQDMGDQDQARKNLAAWKSSGGN